MWFGKALLKLLSYSYSYRLIVLIGQGKTAWRKDSQILIQQVNGGRFTLARVTSAHPITNERGFLPPTSVSPVVLI